MASRDLTNFFIRSRSLFHRPKASFAGGGGGEGGGQDLLGSSTDASVDFSSLSLSGASPVYVETVNELQTDLGSITTRLESMTRLCDQRARINFDPKAEAEKDREIEIETNELTRTFNAAAKRLARLGRHAENAADANENKVVKNIMHASARRLNELSLDFRKRQKQYLGARKRLLDGSGFGSILGAAEGGGGAERDEGFTDAQMNELATAETEVDERMQEIQRIAKSVEDLAVLFKELNTLVVDQGTILDRIDYNMETAVQHVKKGLVEIETADDYSKKARPTKCMLILMVLIVIMTIIIIVRKTPSK